MQIILYLSVALIAIAFLVLVIYLSKTLKSLQETLAGVSGTLKGLEKQLDGVMGETHLLLQKTNALAEDIHQKSKELNSVVTAVKDVGTTINGFNGTLKSITTSVDQTVEDSKEKVAQIIQWSNILLELKDKWQARKQANNEVNSEDKPRIRAH
ncbi:DUF948 domain-containing protein [Paenibacillus sp. BSR1-1]|uniref:DUF948 domain-containing protein n=1 Tax=Paenibacillus sp. BSR1-1 TaxID=3020845 RepID=UPI0025AFADE5|nr:DUF948 domain-containing protein [Paenibacillus sp. BSR1-1]MDN3018198.1 DUF948 domain-containing protein [Paenibacillus sp. BSR1-1]